MESPWFGPYQILEVRSGSLKIAVSPSLGGEVLVALCHVKKWSQILEHDEEFSETHFSLGQNDPDDMCDSDDDVKHITTPENSPPKVAQPPQQISQEISDKDKEKASSSQNDLPKGYYNVEAILKHKYDQGWKFLTKWENFPMASSTWEPPRSFKLGKNLWNQIFLKYCQSNDLQVTPNGNVKLREERKPPPQSDTDMVGYHRVGGQNPS